MKPLYYLVKEYPMDKPKDTTYYQQILTKNRFGEWETSEQQFQRELREGKWILLGYKKSYHVWTEWTEGFSHRYLGGPIPKRDIRKVTGGWYKEYYDGNHT